MSVQRPSTFVCSTVQVPQQHSDIMWDDHTAALVVSFLHTQRFLLADAKGKDSNGQ